MDCVEINASPKKETGFTIIKNRAAMAVGLSVTGG
jgi:hypothetical protein